MKIIICRVPRTRDKSKFLYQDTDILVIVADECAVVCCCLMLYLKEILQSSHGDEQVLWQPRGQRKWARVLCCQCLSSGSSAIDLTYSETISLTSAAALHSAGKAEHSAAPSVSWEIDSERVSASSCLARRLAYSSHASTVRPKFRWHEHVTDSTWSDGG